MPIKIKLPKNRELKKLKEDEEILIKESLSKATPTPREHPRAERSSPKTFGDRMTKFK